MTLPWAPALPRTTAAPSPAHSLGLRRRRGQITLQYVYVASICLQIDSQHKQPSALGRSPLFSSVPIKRSWTMLTTWSLGILDPKDPAVLSPPVWIKRRFLLALCTDPQYLGQTPLRWGARTPAGAPEGDRHFCTVLPLIQQALLVGCRGAACCTSDGATTELCVATVDPSAQIPSKWYSHTQGNLA